MLDKIRSQLVNNAAQILRSPVHFLPTKVHNKLLLEAMKAIFKEALEDGDFEFLQEKWLKIHIRDLKLSWYISYDEALLVADTPKQEDVSFSADLNDLVLIAGRKEDPDTLFFQRRLTIEGDTELGLEVKNLMDSVDLDALPKPMFSALMRLANFVQLGLQSSQNLSRGTPNAY